MARIFGEIHDNKIEEGVQITEFDIPAVNKTLAKKRARANARLKELQNPQVQQAEVVGSGSLPGFSVFRVVVVSERD